MTGNKEENVLTEEELQEMADDPDVQDMLIDCFGVSL